MSAPSSTSPAPATAPTARPPIAGPDTPVVPYPVLLRGAVAKGFGRGSKELGIPTANLPEEAAQLASRVLKSGIYYGWASLPSLAREGQEATEDRCWPMVMSFGWNPYYKNERRTAEVHILHDFPADFYGEEMRVCVAGYLRDEKDYTSVEALIEDINVDIAVAKKSLARPAYEALRGSEFLRGVGEGFTGEA